MPATTKIILQITTIMTAKNNKNNSREQLQMYSTVLHVVVVATWKPFPIITIIFALFLSFISICFNSVFINFVTTPFVRSTPGLVTKYWKNYCYISINTPKGEHHIHSNIFSLHGIMERKCAEWLKRNLSVIFIVIFCSK